MQTSNIFAVYNKYIYYNYNGQRRSSKLGRGPSDNEYFLIKKKLALIDIDEKKKYTKIHYYNIIVLLPLL